MDFQRLARWRRQRAVQNGLTVLLVVLGPVLTMLTFLILGGPLDRASASPLLRLILLADLVYVIIVAGLVIQRVTSMIVARRNRSAGSRLHLRLTGVFVALALIPTVLVAIFAVLSINLGFEGWFSERVQNVLGTSLTTAQAYDGEERSELLRDANALAGFLNTERQTNFFMNDGDVRQAIGSVQNQLDRGLSEVFFIDGAGEIMARGARSYDFNYERPTPADFTAADATGSQIIEDGANNEFRALLPMETFPNRYLYVTRAVDGQILSLLDDTEATVALYDQLERDRGQLLFQFGFLYLGFAVILILAATWLGLQFAERLSRPIGRLVSASQRVGAGDLDVQVIEDDGDDEISQLGHYFNQMTSRLKGQRDDLMDSNRLFDSVLSSVTSGVVGLDPEGRIAFLNPSAARMLSMGPGQAAAASLAVAVPELAPLFERLRRESRPVVQEQVNLVRGGKQESLLVRMAPRTGADGVLDGYVVAFDDVTDLVSAQRMAAWGDVARRIAHEIKNPLTPIQLSAERIKRKFSSEVKDSAKLDQMTDVIVRQTNDLRRIVDEFSKFARMPEPQLAQSDLIRLVRDAVTLQEAGQPGVRITTDLPEGPVLVDLDDTMIGQALNNLIKNAGEAIETLQDRDGVDAVAPQIRIALTRTPTQARITVSDNGIGLPTDRARLFEPYVTTRDKGTGLGLPIVRKIIEEHGGTLSLADADPFDDTDRCGACAVILLPLAPVGITANKIPA
ncbi:sensor histidine kinase NtrY-like [Loktanella sp. M215]|uniref:sensor histidine kinase NtrY-like n=1 Tax=Loktanella sp. M215 TaxID=2675431 RepID=UPI001F1FCF24|nr:PAS domain-containing sensor histidine kinase [Loktanella sp. M215]MCF7700231.1 HAMP domain-containing protein [Loktanella sp. M215]